VRGRGQPHQAFTVVDQFGTWRLFQVFQLLVNGGLTTDPVAAKASNTSNLLSATPLNILPGSVSFKFFETGRRLDQGIRRRSPPTGSDSADSYKIIQNSCAPGTALSGHRAKGAIASPELFMIASTGLAYRLGAVRVGENLYAKC